METNLSDEARLIKQFIESKDNDAFIKLIAGYIPGIRRILYGILNGNIEDIEDAEQELILSLYKSISKFNFTSSFKTYIYRIARNKAVDIVRRKERERKLKNLIHFNFFRNLDDPEEQVLKNEKKHEVFKRLLSLNREDRLIIILKDIEGFSINEISEILTIPMGTVKSRLHRSRLKLAGLLNGDMP